MRVLAAQVFVVAAILSRPSAADAHDFRTTVTTQLEAASRPVTGSGYKIDPTVLSRDVLVGMLGDGTSSWWS